MLLKASFLTLSVLGILLNYGVCAEGTDVKRDGAFGFPQAQSQVLCDRDELRVSAWSNAEYLYVQAIIWADGDDQLAELNGRRVGDYSQLLLDIDTDRQRTRMIDRTYSVGAYGEVFGLRYQVALSDRGSTAIQADSKGRGSINYIDGNAGKRIRVDSFLIPLEEIGKSVGETIRVAHFARSRQPELILNSVGFESDATYTSTSLPQDQYHQIKLVEGATFDPKLVPEGRETASPQPSEPVSVVPELTIGSRAPALDIEHWVQNGKGKFDPVKDFTPGKVYVVEFWATWCGPCIAAMPHIAELQGKHADQGLQVVSISDEKLDIVEKFLERKVPAQKDKESLTYRELTSAYCLTTDPDRSNHDNYMKAAGQNGIPTAFVVGQEGFIEWIGHPMSIDKALSGVIDGKWDRVAYAAEFKEKEEFSRRTREIMDLAYMGKFESALQAIADARAAATADAIKKRADSLVRSVRRIEVEKHILMNSNDAVAKLESFCNGQTPELVNDVVWDHVVTLKEKGRNIRDEILASALQLTTTALVAAPEDGNLLDTHAHLLQLNGKLDQAIEVQEKAVKFSDEKSKANVEEYLDKLRAIKNPSAKSTEVRTNENTSVNQRTSSSVSGMTLPLFKPPKSDLNLTKLEQASLELVSAPNVSLDLATFRSQGRAASKDYRPSNPALVPMVTKGTHDYKIVQGGLEVGAVPYTDRAFKIASLSKELHGLTLLQTKMGHKGIVDARFSIVVSTTMPCLLFIAMSDPTIRNIDQHGAPFWLQEFSATDFTLETDNPIGGTYRIFVKAIPSGRTALGPCCTDPDYSCMFFAFVAQVASSDAANVK